MTHRRPEESQAGSISPLFAVVTSTVVAFGVALVFHMAALRKNVVDQGKLDVCLAEKALMFRDVVEVIEVTNTMIRCARTVAKVGLALEAFGITEPREAAIGATRVLARGQDLVSAFWTYQQIDWVRAIALQKICGTENTVAFPLPGLPFLEREKPSSLISSGESPLEITEGEDAREFLFRAYRLKRAITETGLQTVHDGLVYRSSGVAITVEDGVRDDNDEDWLSVWKAPDGFPQGVLEGDVPTTPGELVNVGKLGLEILKKMLLDLLTSTIPFYSALSDFFDSNPPPDTEVPSHDVEHEPHSDGPAAAGGPK